MEALIVGIVAAVAAPAVAILGYRWRYSGNPFRAESAKLWDEKSDVTAQWRAMLDKVEDMFDACLAREQVILSELEKVRADNTRLSLGMADLTRRVHHIENGDATAI